MVQVRGGKKIYANNEQMFKTTMCRFHQLGTCQRGERCKHAHSADELRSRPDLTKTSLCRKLLIEGECNNPRCGFAHAKDELRSTGAFFKTKPCKFFASGGSCAFGDMCRYLHAPQVIPQVNMIADSSNSSESGSLRDCLSQPDSPPYVGSSNLASISLGGQRLPSHAMPLTLPLGVKGAAIDTQLRTALEDSIQKYIHTSGVLGNSSGLDMKVYTAETTDPSLLQL